MRKMAFSSSHDSSRGWNVLRTIAFLYVLLLKDAAVVVSHDSRRNRRSSSRNSNNNDNDNNNDNNSRCNNRESSSSDAVLSEGDIFSQNRARACRFYTWNVASAGLHSLCQHLSKDCTYEGRGGRKFVLIPPGSLLQLLYPSRDEYSPDACVWCGGTFAHHVALQWSARHHLYSPLDLWLDRTQQRARTALRLPKVWPNIPPDEKKIYSFHDPYVVPHDTATTTTSSSPPQHRLENVYGVSFFLPRHSPSKSGAGPWSGVIREIVECQLKKMIQIQEIDNEVMDLKEHGQYSRQTYGQVRRMLQKRQLIHRQQTKAAESQGSTKPSL